MTFKWSSDNCQCILEIDENFNYVNWFQKCFIHKDQIDQRLLDTALAHNKAENEKGGTVPEIEERNRAEYLRIKRLGDPIVHNR